MEFAFSQLFHRLLRLNLAYNNLFYNDIPQSLKINQLCSLFLCVCMWFFFKEQLESESVKLKKTEEDSNLKEKKFESIITAKEDEIKNLKKQLKEINEAQNCVQVSRYEKEVRKFGDTVEI